MRMRNDLYLDKVHFKHCYYFIIVIIIIIIIISTITIITLKDSD